MAVHRTRPRTTKARHHAEWLRLIDVSGPFLSLPVLERVFPHGLDAHEPERSAELRRLYEDWQDTPDNPESQRGWVGAVLRRILELPEELILPIETTGSRFDVRVAQHHETLRPDLVLISPSGRDGAGDPRLLVQIVARDQDVEKPFRYGEWKASPATRMTELVRAFEGVKLGLVTNGEQWMFVHAPRGETAGYAMWLAALWLDEPITLRAFRSLLGVRRFFAVPQDETLETLFVASAKDQHDVTDRLGFQVRSTVEILVGAIDRIDRERQRKLLAGFDERHLYKAAVTTMMRLVFLLYAEEHKLLPVDDPVYAANYAVSTLLEQLQEDEDKVGGDVLERRHAAWNRLLATFRAVHGGVEHDAMRLPAHGGGLFDPDRFPFLEGRSRESRWRETPSESLPIDDGTVLDLLQSLQFLEVRGLSGNGTEAQRLSFKALGVEQIGNVYETLLDHTAVRAERPVLGLTGPDEPEILIDDLEVRHGRDRDEVVRFLAAETGRSPAAIEGAFRYEIDRDDTRWLVSCGNDPELLARVRPWAGLVREDSRGIPVVVERGSVYITRGSDRRSTGTHYTPPSLTEPIVRYTLEPLVYEGPADGKPEEEWTLRPAREILALKVCDMACGSGAFLVQACRYLSERLVEAWSQAEAKSPGHVIVTPDGELSKARPSDCIVPKGPDERLTVARRLVADRCLYGVDVNPMAVEMAKLSLWLVTLEKGKPFTFLDHAIKSGDSLLGAVTLEQIEDFTLDPGGKPRFLFLGEACRQALQTADSRRKQLESFTVLDIRDATEKARLLSEAEDAVAAARTIGDVLIGLALAETTNRRRDDDLPNRPDVERSVAAAFDTNNPEDVRLRHLANLADAAEKLFIGSNVRARRPFHWSLEFPELVFTSDGRSGPRLHAFIGNPPFMGGRKISSNISDEYERYLKRSILSDKGSVNLVVYFILRAVTAMREGGSFGFIATDAIRESDSRSVGLQAVLRRTALYRAISSMPWPGSAGVSISVLHGFRGQWNGSRYLDERRVHSISSFLTEAAELSEPKKLQANAGLCSDGVKVQGAGFVITADEASRLIAQSAKNTQVLSRYIVGDDINNDPAGLGDRWVINFWNMSEAEARQFTEPWRIVADRVKPYRARLTKQVHEQSFWKFWDRREGFFNKVRRSERVLVSSKLSKHLALLFGDPRHIYSEKVKVFAFTDYAAFAILQSTVHAAWALHWGSSTGATPAYVGSLCFDTFPFPCEPNSFSRDRQLNAVGEQYYVARDALMSARHEGLTKTYNRIHDPRESAAELVGMRSLHAALDETVVGAYGWRDIDLDHGFHETKYGVRFTVSEATRQAVLERLVVLNHERHQTEAREGPNRGRRAGVMADAEEETNGE
jgi:hypothetical protein